MQNRMEIFLTAAKLLTFKAECKEHTKHISDKWVVKI